MMAKVILGATKQTTVLRGHPWIFPKAIAKIQGQLNTGDLVAVYDSHNELIAVGVFNEYSLYRVRVLALAKEEGNHSDYRALITHRLHQAIQVRTALNLPNEKTTAYRLFNSEADGLSGLTIDRFNQICVVASSAYWVELHKDLIKQIIQELLPQDEVLWLPQIKPLKQDGWLQVAANEALMKTTVYEEGVQYQIQFAQAQKTGLFLDQRENHQRIAALASGKRVLDLYTYTGGFALHAAKAGAREVTAIDSSTQAIEQARQNAALNQLTQIDFIAADAREFLIQAGDYDVVILDPPKLVPSRKDIERAKNYYRFLHREVLKPMRSGSLLMSCNCSSALSSQEFCSLISAQAIAVGRQVRVLGIYGPASCHPTLASFPEGNYLTAVLLAVV